MALMKCAECGEDVSTKAKACPFCGAKPKKPTSKVLLALLGVIFVGSAGFANFASKDEREAAKLATEREVTRVAALTPGQKAKEAGEKAEQAKEEAARKATDEQAKAAFETRQKDIGMAEVTCSIYAEKRAHDPGSMDWLSDEKQFAFTSKDGKQAKSVQALRAKNAMGALIKSSVACDLVKDQSGWQVKRFAQSGG